MNERFHWKNYLLRLKTPRPALRLWDQDRPTWYVVTQEEPAQLWRVSEDGSCPGGLTTTFMRTAPTVDAAIRLAESHWKAELERGLHEDAFPLQAEPSLDPRPQPFWKSRDHKSIVD